jgi:hypothetical protein
MVMSNKITFAILTFAIAAVVAGISTIDIGIQTAYAQNPNPNPQGSGSPYTQPPGQVEGNPEPGSPYGQYVNRGAQNPNTNWGEIISNCAQGVGSGCETARGDRGYGIGDERANDQSNLEGSKFPPTRDEEVSGSTP